MIMEKRLDFDRPALQCTDVAEGEGVQLSRDIGLGFAEAPLARLDRASSFADTAFQIAPVCNVHSHKGILECGLQ